MLQFVGMYLFIVGFPDSSVGKESGCNVGDPSSIPGSGRSPGERIGYALQYSWTSLVAQLVKNLPAMLETWVRSLGWKDPWRREHLCTPVFRPGEFHGLCRPWGYKELDTTERLSLHSGDLKSQVTWVALNAKQIQGQIYGKMWVMAIFSMRRAHAVCTPIHISHGPGHICSVAVLEWRLDEYFLIFYIVILRKSIPQTDFWSKSLLSQGKILLSPLFLWHPNPSTIGKSHQQGEEDITYERNLHLVHNGNLGIKGMFPYFSLCITISKISRIYPASHYLSHQTDR